MKHFPFLLSLAAGLGTACILGGFSAAAGGEANDWIDMAAALGCAAVLLRDFTCRPHLRGAAPA